MDYELIIAEEVEFDIVDAVDWYNKQVLGLGFDFLEAVYAAYVLIQDAPNHFQIRYDNIRICFLKRFPYGIHYTVENKTIKVLMVIHASRSPKLWNKRSK